MKNIRLPLVAAVAIATFTGCQQHATPPAGKQSNSVSSAEQFDSVSNSVSNTEQSDTISNVEQSNSMLDAKGPAEDAVAAFNNHDMRFLGIQTRGLTMPGIKVAEQAPLIERYGVRLYGQGKDVIRNEKDRKVMLDASSYVEQYNKTMLQLINRNQ